MKFAELLKNLRKLINEWGIFFMLAILLNFFAVTGIIYQKPTIESEISPIVKYFNEAAEQFGAVPDFKNLRVDFVDKFQVDNWIGLCQRNNSGTVKFMSIKKSYFSHTSVEQKYALVIHELGHCTLKLSHKEGYRENGCPISIMHPSDGLFGCFFKDQEYYFKELFQK